ncbi:EAL domain-containing protein [Nevskia ramosa]|uniref:EAL domain-containing protein n=1 Tax=Nevskia ramosa TaxID=64002 RepID=UPI0009FCB30B|nr:GGDEF domain-containing protein [Nevskia ramosa]
MNLPREPAPSRAAFRAALAASSPAPGSVRAALLLHIDGWAGIEERIGFVEAEALAGLVSAAINTRLTPDDARYALSIDETGLILQRADLAGIERLAETLRRELHEEIFTIRDQEVQLSVTLAWFQTGTADTLDAMLHKLVGEARAASLKGGNTVIGVGVIAPAVQNDREDARIAGLTRRALAEDRMRLAFQSIASLEGGRHTHFDLQVRMVDEDGREWRATEFLPAAQKFNLMRSVDRWVIATALDIVQRRRGTRDAATLFIKLSEDTVRDAEAFILWLRGLLDGQRLKASEVVFQAQELVLQNHIRKARALTRELVELGAGVAIEHFGVGSNSRQMLDYIPAQFLKFHASYTQSFADREVQKRLGDLIEAAKQHRMKTIVSHVERADMMAKLWQMGIHFIQGYHVQEPEVVMLGEDLGVKR